MNQEVKFFVVDYGLDPFSNLEERINKWINQENRPYGIRMVVDSISHNVCNGKYSALVLYHHE